VQANFKLALNWITEKKIFPEKGKLNLFTTNSNLGQIIIVFVSIELYAKYKYKLFHLK
jgi:hypothetical protein